MRCIFLNGHHQPVWHPIFFTNPWKNGQKNGSLKLTQRIHVDYKKHFSWKNVGANFKKTDIEAHFIVVWEQFVWKIAQESCWFLFGKQNFAEKIAGCKKSSCALCKRAPAMHAQSWLAGISANLHVWPYKWCLCSMHSRLVVEYIYETSHNNNNGNTLPKKSVQLNDLSAEKKQCEIFSPHKWR